MLVLNQGGNPDLDEFGSWRGQVSDELVAFAGLGHHQTWLGLRGSGSDLGPDPGPGEMSNMDAIH